MTESTREHIIHKSLKIRAAEKRLLTLFQEGKINGTVHTCIGQELIGATVATFLKESDCILSNHRGHGHFLARNDDLTAFFAEIMGRQGGVCGGLGGSQHLYTKNHISNGIQGGMTPIGVGIALANKLKETNDIVVCFIGDGTLGEGIIYEAFNIASLWNLPIVFVLENNGIAQSTLHQQVFSGSTEKRALGFGLEYISTTTRDLDDLYNACEKAITNARAFEPTFLEVETHRLYSHSKGDDNRFQKDIDEYDTKDVLNIFLLENANTTTDVQKNIENAIDIAVEKALQSPETLSVNTIPSIYESDIVYSEQKSEGEDKRINHLINEALKSQFKTESKSILIGEDIEYLAPNTAKPYGGAFKVTGNLSDAFKNVKNTPISEAALVGVGTGLALRGMRPIVEIMFGDFLTLTFDQVYNHACKFSAMFNGQINVPLVIRTPMGGKRGYGPTHSQSIEKFFLGITNLLVVVLNNRISPKDIYSKVFKEKNPVLVIENKVLYTQKLKHEASLGYQVNVSNEQYPTIKITPIKKQPDITILCYGETLSDVEEAMDLAFEEEEILCEILCPTKIYPINLTPILNSLTLTKRLLIIEEGPNIASYSSEVAANILAKGLSLKAFHRLANNSIIPSSAKAEYHALPNKMSIFQSIKKTCNV